MHLGQPWLSGLTAIRLRKVLFWSVLTALWFLMVSSCSRITLGWEGHADPTDQFHGWYRFFVSLQLVSLIVSTILAAFGFFVWRKTRQRRTR